jgi:hypothetical protein
LPPRARIMTLACIGCARHPNAGDQRKWVISKRRGALASVLQSALRDRGQSSRDFCVNWFWFAVKKPLTSNDSNHQSTSFVLSSVPHHGAWAPAHTPLLPVVRRAGGGGVCCHFQLTFPSRPGRGPPSADGPQAQAAQARQDT